MNHWHTLGIPPTRDEAAIKHAYAQKLKQHRPDRDPQGFIALRAAYEAALAYGTGTAETPCAPSAGDAPQLDPRHLSRSWRKAKSDDALLALLQEQSRQLPTIDEQLDYRDILSSWIEARDRPRRYPQSLIWAVDRYRLLHGLEPDDPLRDDYLRALIICGERDKALAIIATRYPPLAHWLRQPFPMQLFLIILVDDDLAKLQNELDLDDDAIRAAFPDAVILLPRFVLPSLGLAAAAVLARWPEWQQAAHILAILCACTLWRSIHLRITRGGATLPFAAPAPLYAGALACYVVLGTCAPAAWHFPVTLAGILTAILAYSRLPADDIPRRHYLYSIITLGIPLNLTATDPLLALYWLIPCLAAASRYHDYALNFQHFIVNIVNTVCAAVLIQTGWQLWLLRGSHPVPAALAAACLLVAAGSSLRAGDWGIPAAEEEIS